MWRSFAGAVRVEITSASPAEALSAISAYDIALCDVRYHSDLVIYASVARKDYRKLSELILARGDTLKIKSRSGLYWRGKGMLRRPLLLFGILVYLVLVLYLPTRVLFIRVEGNHAVSTQKILEKANQCGIGFGASRREVRSEKVKNNLLALIPELQWVGVNTSGCVAVISVNERTAPEEKGNGYGVSSIVASRDGVIQKCTVTKGNQICRVGQAVKAGEVLVSGYTDCGISIKATRADAEILALTQRELTAVTPTAVSTRTNVAKEISRYSLIFGKNLINFYNDSGISDTSCAKMYNIDYLTLPGGFQLPVALVKERLIYYNFNNTDSVNEDDFSWVGNFSKRYTQEHMIAGEILDAKSSTALDEGICRVRSQYHCLEMIGRIQNEEIIQKNGKND